MTFRTLSRHLHQIEQTPSRILMTKLLATLLKKATAHEIDRLCYLSLGRLVPLYQSLEFNLAEKMVMRAMAGAYGVDLSKVLAAYKKVGDLGVVGEDFRIKNSEDRRQKHLSVLEVYSALRAIAEDSGEGSQERKVQGLARLLIQLDSLSVRYVVRIVLGKLRLGFSDKTLLDALSWMESGTKDGRTELALAYQVMPDIGRLARLAKQYGVARVADKAEVTLGVPVMPALAQRLKSPKDMITKMGRVLAEAKFDGTRVQIHYRRQKAAHSTGSTGSPQAGSGRGDRRQNGEWTVKSFTRNLEESSAMFPEIQQVGEQIVAESVILDSEAMGYNPKTGKLLPFQQTMTRKRKYDVDLFLHTVPLTFFVFDILYKDGKSLLSVPLLKRRKILAATVKPGKILQLSDFIVTDDATELSIYHEGRLTEGFEGAMVKKIEAPYTPGRTGWSWVKFKEAEEAAGKLADTIDCVVMGLYRGRGKRAAFGVGAFLVGIVANEKVQSSKLKVQSNGDSILTIAKIGTGLSDEQWRELAERIKKYESRIMNKTYVVHKNLIPDVWVDPGIVVEIAADEITKSPVHSAGVALRFPRLVRFRDDKSPEQATALSEVKQLARL